MHQQTTSERTLGQLMLFAVRKAGSSAGQAVDDGTKPSFAFLPVDPLNIMSRQVLAHRLTDRREECVLAEPTEQAKSLELVFNRVFHLGEAQFDVDRLQGLIEVADCVGGGNIDARDRLGRYDDPTDWVRCVGNYL